MKLVVALVAVVALASVTGHAFACGGEPDAENLVATQYVKQGLLRAYSVAHPGVSVTGPVVGATYYGHVWGRDYALARFEVNGEVSQPALLSRRPGHPWHWSRDTHGGICSNSVDDELLRLWSLAPWKGPKWWGSCYALPAV